MTDVINFLELNGFEKIEADLWGNNRCSVEINDRGYAVANDMGDAMYSRDHNIYWLIGVLTYYNFMPREYKTYLPQ